MISARGIHNASSGLAGGLAAALVEQSVARRVVAFNARIERGDMAAVQRLAAELAASRKQEAALQQQVNDLTARALIAEATVRRMRKPA